MINIAIYGGGSWGTALACQVARKNNQCILFVRDKAVAEDIKNNRLNSKYLGKNMLAENIIPTDDIEQIKNQQIIIIALPSTAIKQAIEILRSIKINPNSILLIATKGLISDPTMLVSEYVTQLLPNPIAFISGPNFALEVVNNWKTYATIAATNINIAQICSEALGSENFIISCCDDIISLQIAGSVKNIIAIQSGIYQAELEAKILGENAKAALITLGLQEISVVAQFFGGKVESVKEVGVIGDLILTCSSLKSRNAKFGYELAKVQDKNLFIQNYHVLVEGLNQAKLIEDLINTFEFNLPLLSSIIKTLNL